MLFNKVTIIGLGLIGSSIARIIKQKNLAKTLVAVDASKAVCDKVMELGIADEATREIRNGVADADLVILAVPVGACGAVAEQIRYALKDGAIVTDTGSVKGTVVEQVMPHLKDNVHFVPAHPIAGTEHSGPEAGFTELFIDRWCIITPLPDSDIQAVEKVTALWEACGSRIEIMDVKRHDLVLAITSHLPHLIAYTIVGTATDLEEDTKDDVIKFSASGFRDFTRIAASDPVMWRDVFLNNKEAVLEILQRFNEDLTGLQKAIRKGNGQELEDHFTKTRKIRREVIEAGQAA
jgi:cyclohexadieny/prephenate dehydrogenase